MEKSITTYLLYLDDKIVGYYPLKRYAINKIEILLKSGVKKEQLVLFKTTKSIEKEDF